MFSFQIHIKDDSEKGRFYVSLVPALDNFPAHVGSYKILPELIKAFEFGNAGAAILGENLGVFDLHYCKHFLLWKESFKKNAL